jgi:RNA polymerase sigma-70 factor (ECF subfamily)
VSLKDDAEAEDALQEAYLAAYNHIGSFRADATLATWLTRIVINEALGRLRRRKRDGVVVPFAAGTRDDQGEEVTILPDDILESPETSTMRAELRRLLEHRIDELPVAFRTVFILREVEELTVGETAQCLSIPEATVRTRFFRARGLLREGLANDIDIALGDAFSFDGERCDRIVAAVMAKLDADRGTGRS